ncbi:MAG: PAS domain S-box protein [Roseococcus sp.]|nr:PAS domain S-box protein [Roseococcus sp.]
MQGNAECPPRPQHLHDWLALAAALAPIALVRVGQGQGQGEGQGQGGSVEAGIGLEAGPAACAARFCDEVMRARDNLVIPDAAAGQGFGTGPDGPGPRFFAGTPILSSTGEALGAICVMDMAPRPDFGVPARHALAALGRMVAGHLAREREAVARAQRATLLEEMLHLTAEAPDFETAMRQACSLLRKSMQAISCQIFRAAADPAAPQLLRNAGPGAPNLAGSAAAALERQAQLVEHDPPHGPVRIATPFAIREERYAVVLECANLPQDTAEAAQTMTEAISALRPLLRRARDQERALMFQRAVEASLDPVLITEAEPIDEPGPRIVYANEAFTRETGYSAAEAIGRSPRFLQGPGTSAEAMGNIRRALRAWQPVRQEILNYRKDGSTCLIELNIAPVADASGWYTHWVSIQRDVTREREIQHERMHMGQELERLISGMPGALMRLHHVEAGSFTAQYSSPSIQGITGYAPQEITRGFMARHMTGPDLVRLRAGIAQALAEGKASLEFLFRHRDGQNRLILSHLKAEPAPRGQEEVVMTWSDITKERMLAVQLEQAAKLAQLGEVATGMAHEMNQPLAGISLAAENAQRLLSRLPDVPRRVDEKLETIIALAQRAAATIDHMRVFGRTGSGPSGRVVLADVLAGAGHLVEGKLRGAGVTLVQFLPSELSPVLGKQIPLEQVLINLISNACDAYAAMAVKPPEALRLITLTAEAVDGRVRLHVQDHAGGIPAEILPRIFEPFFTTKDVGQGTGLGLSISYGIITDLGGTIAAELAEGGTRFTLELPAAQAA